MHTERGTDEDQALETAHQSLLRRRIAAFCYDLFPIISLLILVTAASMLIAPDHQIKAGTWWHQLLLVLSTLSYYVLSWMRFGQTIGMRAWRLRLVSQQPLTVARCSARFLLSLVSLIPLGAGFLWSLKGPEHLAWHDRWTDSRLILTPPDH